MTSLAKSLSLVELARLARYAHDGWLSRLLLVRREGPHKSVLFLRAFSLDFSPIVFLCAGTHFALYFGRRARRKSAWASSMA